jgi:aminoglycoside phosphotransferase (APT) family kinase protein
MKSDQQQTGWPMPPFPPTSTATLLGISASATISPAPQGMTSEVAFVEDQGRQSVVKRCRNPIYVEWLRREQQVLLALSSSSLRVPRVIGYHELRQEDGQVDAWLHMTRVAGRPLEDVLTSQVERRRHLGELGKLLRELHASPPPAMFEGQRPWIERTLALARNNLAWCDGSADLLAHLEATRPAPVAEALVHGDLALDNVLVDDSGELGLIDWSGGDLGDPRYDLALALAPDTERQIGGEDAAAFFDGYGGTPVAPETLRWFVQLYEFF